MTKIQKKDFLILLDDFKDILRKNGLKYTKQREAILETIFTSKTHFSSEDLHLSVAERFPELKTGIATVYRTLVLLEEEGIVTSVSFGTSGKKYEYGRKDHHDHMICDNCGKMIEFLDDTIELKQEEIAKQHKFKISGHSMQLHGLCETCQKDEK